VQARFKRVVGFELDTPRRAIAPRFPFNIAVLSLGNDQG
jgi:hypothetical protein